MPGTTEQPIEGPARAAADRAGARPLAMRFMIALIPAIFVINILSAAIIGLHAMQSAKAELHSKRLGLVGTRAALIAEPLWNFRYEVVRAALQDLTSNSDVIGIVVRDESGAAVVELGRRERAEPSARIAAPISYANGNVATQIGHVDMLFDDDPLAQQIRDRAFDAILFSVLSSIAVIICVLLVTRTVILLPLGSLSRAIARSRAEGRRVKADTSADGEIGSVISTFNAMQDHLEQNETVLRELNIELERLSRTDSLTGVLNRSGFLARARERLAAATARGGRAVIAFVDLDRFKAVNDSYGHSVGDRLIAIVADRFHGAFGRDGLVGRLGGDELAVLVDNRHAPIDKGAMGERIRRLVRQPVEIDTLTLDVSASVGIAASPEDGMDIEALLVAADRAMYRAKSEGRDRCAIHDADIAARREQWRTIEADLRDSLRQGWIRIAVQPIVDLASLRPIGGEVLARLCHPQRGEIPPSVFIPVAQETGQIAAIGEFVMEEALRVLPDLRRHCESDSFYLAVNLAAHQLSEQLPDSLAAMLDRAGAAADDLVLEITESVIVRDDRRHDEIIGRLKNLGFRFALDDFGTGQSPMSYVDRFKTDILKIDRSFVQLDPDDGDADKLHQRAMLKAMVTLGRELRIPIVAEGIETEQHLLAARALGIGLGQGYLFSQPLPPAAMARWLASFRNSDVERSIREVGTRHVARR